MTERREPCTHCVTGVKSNYISVTRMPYNVAAWGRHGSWIEPVLTHQNAKHPVLDSTSVIGGVVILEHKITDDISRTSFEVNAGAAYPH